MKPELKPIKKLYICPYCQFVYEDEGKSTECLRWCSTADLVEKEFFYDSTVDEGKWNPPPIQDFREWSRGDRVEFVRRMEIFFQKYYR